MAEELQSLLERIQEEGVKKADSEKEKILADAKVQADKILSDAKNKADEIIRKSEKDSKRNEERAASTIRQAARDVILSLNEELRERLEGVVKGCIGKAMTPDLMGKLIIEMQKNYLEKSKGQEHGIELLLNKKDLSEMEKLFKASLVEELKCNPEISIGHDFSSGLKIGFKGNDLFFDFSDDALSEIICDYIGPRLAAIVNEPSERQK